MLKMNRTSKYKGMTLEQLYELQDEVVPGKDAHD